MNDDQTKTAARFTKGKVTLLSDATEIVWHKTKMKMYGVSDSQLEELTAGYNSMLLVLFGVFAGATATLWVALKQASASDPNKPYYFVALLSCLGLTLISGAVGFGRLRAAHKCKEKLYKESVPIERP